MHILLTPNDRRIGIMQPEGTQWPEVDVMGNTYDRHNASVFSLKDAGRFVVIPPNRWQEIDGIEMAPEPIAEPPISDGDTPSVGTLPVANAEK